MDVCKFDIAKANKLLDEAGWAKGSDGIRAKDGVKMRSLYQTTVNPLRQKEQDIVKAGWEKLGVEVELKSVDAGVFFSSDAGNPDTAATSTPTSRCTPTAPISPTRPTTWRSWTTAQIASKANELARQQLPPLVERGLRRDCGTSSGPRPTRPSART